MNEPTHCRVAFVGLPATGKSTYIEALYQACLAKRDGLVITHLGEGQRDYLNDLGRQLAKFASLTRTPQSEPGELDLRIKLSGEGDELQLLIPDLSGEHLQAALGGEHALDSSLHNLLLDVASVLLCVRVDTMRAAETIVDFNALMNGVDDARDDNTAPDQSDEWSVDLAATQVQLTHALQEIMRLRGNQPIRLALLLSAWDRAGSTSPKQWTDENLALLTQVMDDDPQVTWKTFGVSGQGGDFDRPADRARLEGLTLSERAEVCDEDGGRVRISEPVAWSLKLDQ